MKYNYETTVRESIIKTMESYKDSFSGAENKDILADELYKYLAEDSIVTNFDGLMYPASVVKDYCLENLELAKQAYHYFDANEECTEKASLEEDLHQERWVKIDSTIRQFLLAFAITEVVCDSMSFVADGKTFADLTDIDDYMKEEGLEDGTFKVCVDGKELFYFDRNNTVCESYTVCDYEVGGAEYGSFNTFEEAKAQADHLKFFYRKDFSVIKWEGGNGEEIYITKEN